MKVAFNISPLAGGHRVRGIGAYTKNLLAALKQVKDLEIIEFSNPGELSKVDLIHYPFFDLFKRTLPIFNKYPTLVTVHDIIPLMFPQYYPPGVKGSLSSYYQKFALRNTAAIITDSEASKKDIITRFKYPEKKIFVVYLAPSEHFNVIHNKVLLKKITGKYNLPGKFVLFIGNVNWNKNLLNMAEGCVKAGADLVLVGKSFEERSDLNHPEKRSFREFLEKYSGTKLIHILGFVDDADLAAITNLAGVLLLPSFAEGFGLPILEAQKCNTPVITSNVSSMREVAGSGAYFVDPADPSAISRAVQAVLEDKKFRHCLTEEGQKNVLRFSWEKTATQTVKVYEKVLQK